MKKKVLIIDDDEEMCEEMSGLLTDEGYSVTVAFDGYQGVELIGEEDYDIVLLDLKMSGLSGLKLLRRIKVEKPEVKILVLTGKVLGADLVEEKKKKDGAEKTTILRLADGMIHKPYDVTAVLDKIRESTGGDSG